MYTNIMEERARHNVAFNLLATEFALFFQELMMTVGYEIQELQDVNSPTYCQCMHIALIHIGKILQDAKIENNESISGNEKFFFQRILQIRLKPNAKLSNLINLFDESFTKFLQNILIQAHIDEKENDVFIAFLSVSFVFLCEKFLRNSDLNSHVNVEERYFCSEPSQNVTIENGVKQIPIMKAEGSLLSFEIMETIVETKNHFIYCITSNSKKMTLKVLKSKETSDKSIAKLDKELNVTMKITHPAFRSIISRTNFRGQEALLSEFLPGRALSSILRAKKGYNLKVKLSIAREIVSAILAMHQCGLLHMNLSAEHIIYDENSNSVKVIGCGGAVSISDKLDLIQNNHDLLEKDVRYMPPELYSNADFRSDLYSLGVILFKLFTGVFPYGKEESLQFIQMRKGGDFAPKICTLDADIPRPLSDMLCKLLSRNPNHRYQSAKGIIHDIDLMIEELNSNHQLRSVILGQHDRPSMLHLSQNLYGRSEEYEKLCNIIEQGFPLKSEYIFIAGSAGAGKSRMVLELFKFLVFKNVMFVRGKFDCHKTQSYCALLDAMESFCESLMTNDKVTIANYKSRILEAIGDEGKLLTNVISNLNQVIGQQPEIPDIFGSEGTNRFIYVFIKFIRAISSIKPFILVLEDLHAMDSKSYDILSALVTDKSLKNFVLIGTYRHDEIGEEHMLASLIESVSAKTVIKLRNFSFEVTNEIIADSLCTSLFESYSLSSYIFKKTKGNVFFINQILLSLYDAGNIFYCDEAFEWKWDITALGETDTADDIISFLRKKIKLLDGLTQQTLISASCLGNPFSLNLLKAVVHSEKGIEKAIAAGMVSQYKRSNFYCFAHDNIYQAAFSLLPKENSVKIFWYMAVKLLKNLSRNEIESDIFTVANLFLSAKNSIHGNDDVEQIVELLISASKQAMQAAAYNDAFKFLKYGLNLLGANYWSINYELWISLSNESAKAAYCISDFAALKSINEQICTHARSPVHLVNSFVLDIKVCNDKRLCEEAIKIAVAMLRRLGESFDLTNSGSLLEIEIEKTKMMVCSKRDEEVLSLNQMIDEAFMAIVTILNEILVSAFYVNRKLMAFCSVRIVQITLEKGISKYSCMGFIGMGVYFSTNGEQIGLRCGNLAMILLKKYRIKEFIPICYSMYYGMTTPCYSSIHESIEPLLKACRVSLELGFNFMLTSIANMYVRVAFLCGVNLSRILNDIEELIEQPALKRTSQLLSIYQAVLNLQSTKRKENPAVLVGEAFDVNCCFDGSERPFDSARSLVTCCIVAYLFADYSLAYEYAKHCRELKQNIYQTAVFLFYDSLILIGMTQREKSADDHLMLVQKNLKVLTSASVNAPQNVLNKISLVQAELAALKGNLDYARNCFKNAISLSKENGFCHEEALSHEREGIFYLSNHDKARALQSFTSAYQLYNTWGSYMKAKQLLRTFPGILNQTETFDNQQSFDLKFEATPENDSVSMLSNPSSHHSCLETFTRKKRIRWR